MLAGQRPGGVAMPGQVNKRKRFAHGTGLAPSKATAACVSTGATLLSTDSAGRRAIWQPAKRRLISLSRLGLLVALVLHSLGHRHRRKKFRRDCRVRVLT